MRADYHIIDKRIEPLVRVMNRDGLIKTIASCQGHCAYLNRPYVYFTCSPSTASLIEKRLLGMWVFDEGLRHHWGLKGSFNGKFELCFVLESSALSAASHSFFLLFRWFVLGRRAIDRDFALLETALKEILDLLEQGIVPDLPNPYDPRPDHPQKGEAAHAR